MQEINLYDLVKYYARNWANLLTALFIGAIIGLVYTFYIQEPLYRSEATMLVVRSQSSQDSTINNNYTELFQSRRVLEDVIDKLGYSGDYKQLLSRTTATNDRNTDILKFSIADPEARKSQQLLQASLETFADEAGSLYESNDIETVDGASLPAEPYNVNVITQVGLATAAALILAIIMLFFIYDYRLSQGQTKANSASRKTIKPTKQSSAKKAETKQPASRSIIGRLSNILLGGEPPADKRTK